MVCPICKTTPLVVQNNNYFCPSCKIYAGPNTPEFTHNLQAEGQNIISPEGSSNSDINNSSMPNPLTGLFFWKPNYLNKNVQAGWANEDKSSFKKQIYASIFILIVTIISLLVSSNPLIAVLVLGIALIVYSIFFLNSNVALIPSRGLGYPAFGTWAKLIHISSLIVGVVLVGYSITRLFV